MPLSANNKINMIISFQMYYSCFILACVSLKLPWICHLFWPLIGQKSLIIKGGPMAPVSTGRPLTQCHVFNWHLKSHIFSQLTSVTANCSYSMYSTVNWKCVFPQIKTEDLHGSPHSGSTLRTCHMTQGSPMGQMTGVKHRQFLESASKPHDNELVSLSGHWRKCAVYFSQSESLDS